MKINKVIETCIYSSNLESMKKFYVEIFLKAGKSMLLIFDPSRTSVNNDGLPIHGAMTPPSSIHFAMEIEEQEYQPCKKHLGGNGVAIQKEVNWDGKTKSLYFRDPAGNLVELITSGGWPVES